MLRPRRSTESESELLSSSRWLQSTEGRRLQGRGPGVSQRYICRLILLEEPQKPESLLKKQMYGLKKT